MFAKRVHIALLLSGVCFAGFNPPTLRAQGCSNCRTSQPAATYYQPTTAYQVSGPPAPYYSGNTAQPVAQPVPTQPLYQTRVSRPIPRTSYRTEWVPNRITYYTPTVGVNPTTGAPVVSYRGCQTRGQILQRVPTFNLFTSPTPSYVPSAGCSTCTPSTTIAPSATTTVPSMPPATLSPSPTPATTTTPGPARTTAPQGTEPAETRPSLKPEARTNAQGASIRGLQLQPSYGSRLRNSPPAGQNPQTPPSRGTRVQPVPDPDATPSNDQPAGDAPLLLDPRQKTAAQPTSFDPAYRQVAWPTRRPAPEQVERDSTSKADAAPRPVASEWKTVDW